MEKSLATEQPPNGDLWGRSWKDVNDHTSRSVGQNIVFLKFPQICGFQSWENFDLIYKETTAVVFFPKRD